MSMQSSQIAEETEHPSHLMTLNRRPAPIMVRGRGSYLWDESGRRYLDFVQGWAVNALGHSPPELSEAIQRQAETLINASPAYRTAPQIELADHLARASQMGRVFFCNSGAEANEGAIKLARKWGMLHRGGAHEIITTLNGFHGRTLATMAASGKPGWDAMFPPRMPGFVKVPFGDSAAVKSVIGSGTVAILVEPIQGEGGVVVPPASYLRALREIANDAGILLMLDEVQTGVGRTGTLFAHQSDGVIPDVMTLGKGLGGGVPLAALVTTEAASCFEPGEQGGTFNGNPLATAVGLAVLRAVCRPEFLENVRNQGQALTLGLEKLGTSHGIVEVRGRGLLVAARLDAPQAERVRDAAFELGLLLNAVRPDTLRFMPALNVTGDEVRAMLELLARAMREL
jgi:acetylornithine/N-succinyldiaminopimelate aminotransferase